MGREGWNSTFMPNGSFGGDDLTQDKGRTPLHRKFLHGKCTRQTSCEYQHDGRHDGFRFCGRRDFLKGKHTHGASCTFGHSESDRLGGFRSYGNKNLGISNSETSKSGGTNADDDSMTGSFLREGRSRSPCQKFKVGKCHRGASCQYLHNQNSTYVKPRHGWSRQLRQGVATTRENPDFGEGNVESLIRTPLEHDEANKCNILSTGAFYEERMRKSPCHNFLRDRCYHGATSPYLHPEHTAYVRPWYDWSIQHHEATTSASKSPCFNGTGSIDVFSRMSQEHSEANKDDGLRVRSFSREPRGRSLCHEFIDGKCFRGASCPFLHAVTYDRPMYECSIQQHQGHAAAPGNPLFGERSVDASLRVPQQRDKFKNHGLQLTQDKHSSRNLLVNDTTISEQNGRWPMEDSVQSVFNQQNMDVTSRGRSSERLRSRPLREFGSDKLRHEVCRNFSRGKCQRGESCKYLHDSLGYARCFRQPHFEAAAVLRNFHGPRPPVMHQEHDHVSNDNKCLGEHKHAGSGLISRDVSFDEKIKMQSANDMVKPNIIEDQHAGRGLISQYGCFDEEIGKQFINYSVQPTIKDQKDEVLVMDKQKQEISGGAILGNCDVTEADDDINSWSRPFKRRRSGNRYASNPADDLGCRSVRRDKFKNNFCKDRSYKVAPFRYFYHRSYQYNNPRYHMDDPSQSKVSATSMDLCSQEHEVNDSNLMETDVHDKVTSHGMQLDQSIGGSLDSHTEILNHKNEDEIETGAVQPSHVNKENRDSKVTGPPEDSCSHEVDKDSNFTEIHRYDKVMSHGLQLDQCSGGSLDLNTAILNEKCEAECVKGDVETCHAKQDDEGLVTGSSEIDVSKGKNSISTEFIELGVSSSCEKDMSLTVCNASDLKSSIDTNVNIDLSEGGSVKTAALKTCSRNRRRKRRSKCHMEAMKNEVTDPATQGLSSSSAGRTILSVPESDAGVTNSLKSVAEDNSAENLSTADHSVQQFEQDIDVSIKKIHDNIEPAQTIMENKTKLVGDSDSHSMQTSEPLKADALDSKRKLLILDVNGLLVDIVADVPAGYKPDTVVSKKAVFKRPFCDEFLEFCFQRFDVGVWSSRVEKNLRRVVDLLMKKTQKQLLFRWDQSHCTKTKYKTIENKDKPLFLKELKKLWEKNEAHLPWETGYYNERNTVLLDDSPYKALRNPPYTAVFPYPYTFKDAKDKSLGPGGDLRVYLERLAEADNVQKFIQKNPFGQQPITKSNKYWAFYSRIIGNVPKSKKKKAKKTSAKAKKTPAAS